jgi:hypothetical protein
MINEDYHELTDKKIWSDVKQVARIRAALRQRLDNDNWDLYLIRRNSDWIEVYLKSPKCPRRGVLYDVLWSSKGDKIFEKIGLSQKEKDVIIDIMRKEFGGNPVNVRLNEETNYFPY